MKIKKGVIMSGLQLPMRKALIEANHVYNFHNQELVITSAIDGEHSAGSYHYYGYAVDLRTRYFTDNEALDVAKKIREKLGNDYTVLFETNHIHIQYNA
jgi:hypothetical protein